MSCFICRRISYVGLATDLTDEPVVSSAVVRNAIQLFAIGLAGAALGACAPSSVVTNKPSSLSSSRQASLVQERRLNVTNAGVPVINRKLPASATNKNPAEQKSSHGIASFYWQGVKTANGEKFDAQGLTAAHRTLPFGTRLRVTNVASGQSVTVRVNDRGPFIPGRVVDISYSAAEALGIVERGIARVKLDVVQ